MLCEIIPSIMGKFSDWLLEKMRENDWSQADLARASGLTRQTISYYLGHKSKQPDEFALRQLAKAFEVDEKDAYRAAGILAPEPEITKWIRHITHVMEQLPMDDQEELAEAANLKLKLREKRGNEKRKATKNHGTVG